MNVVVTNTDTGTVTDTNGYRYDSSPTITNVNPTHGSNLGGTSITITGTQFASGATVTIGGASATNVIVVSSTSITATTPAGTTGLVNVVVTNTDTGTVTDTNSYRYDSSPTITNVNPTHGPNAGGTSITITGTQFASGATVTIGGASATNVIVVSSTSITATTPAGTTGLRNVIVTNTDTGTVTDTNGYRYDSATNYQKSNINPSVGPNAGGTSITITGTQFASGATVTIGGNPATGVNVMNATTIIATTPAGSRGAANVVVTNTDTGTVTDIGGFTYFVAPILANPPTANPIAAFTATLNDNVTDDGGDTVSKRGFLYSTNSGATFVLQNGSNT